MSDSLVLKFVKDNIDEELTQAVLKESKTYVTSFCS